MKRILFFFLLLPLLLKANPDAVFSDDEDLTLCHHVNVISGNLNLYFQDLVAEGAQPIPLIRTYTSAGALERNESNDDLALARLRGAWFIQGGWSLLPHTNLFVQEAEDEKKFKIFLPEKNGSFISYNFSHRESDSSRQYASCPIIFKPSIKGGQNSGTLSGRTNLKNNILRFDPLKKKATLFLPDGSSRLYRALYTVSEQNPLYYLTLESETSPSQQHTDYFYSDADGLSRVITRNPSRTKIYSELLFKSIKPGSVKKHFHIRAKTSDKEIHYRSLVFQNRNYLCNVQSNCRPQESVHFVPGRKGIGARIRSLTLGDNLQLTAYYVEPSSKKEENKWAYHPSGKGISTDKVSRLEAPIGPHNEILSVARFSYSSTFTDVRDVDNILTRYHHNNDRLLHIEYFDQTDQKNSSLKFFWHDGNLIGKAFLGKDAQALFSKTFQYDAAGNVVEETLWGNLTGNAPDSFTLESNGTLSGAETYRKTYTYLPTFNVPLSETEEGGLTYTSTYKPGTNLLQSRFTCAQDKILIRQFFFYNEDNLLIAEITDDGTDSNSDNLQNLTERHYKKHQLHPTLGLPLFTQETYLDLPSGQEKLLRKIGYHYSSSNQVIAEDIYDSEEIHRYTLHTTYDSQGRVIAKTTPLGQKNTYRYDSHSNLLESKEIGAPHKFYTYNKSGHPLSCEEIDSEGNGKTSFTHYDSKGRLLSQTDTKGNTTTQKYDCFGKCIETAFPAVTNENKETYHPTIAFTYDANGNLASTTTPRNETTHTTYNTLRKPIRIIHPDGSELRHFYNKNGTLAKTIHPDQTQVHYTYDILQRITSQITYSKDNSILTQETWEYNAFHLLSHTDPTGRLTTYTYDGAGRTISECVEKREKHFSYDALGYLEKTTDGNITQVEIHNAAGLIVSKWTEDKQGRVENHMDFFYDEENRKIKAIRTTSQEDAVDLFAYDESGRLCRHTDPLQSTTQFIYTDILNELNQYVLQKNTIDPLLNQTVEIYDALSHLVLHEKKDPQGNTVSKEEFFYDRAGNRSKRLSTIYNQNTPLKQICTLWEYDCFGNVTKEVESNQKTTLYTYDASGRISTQTLPSQITFFHSYDGIGRLTELVSSDKTVHYQYLYEKGPQPTEVLDLCQKTTLKRIYNCFGQLTKEINPAGLAFQWEYDTYGRCTLFTLPDLSSIAYSYDGAHLTLISRLCPHGKRLYEHRYTQFDPNGHIQQEELIHALGPVTTTHDILERPSTQSCAWLQQNISYGPSGLVESTQNSLFGTKNYAYDPLNQLIQEGNQDYHFDSLGNPTTCEVNDCNQILSTPDFQFLYDPDGNPTKRIQPEISTSYTYDALGRLTEIIYPDKKVQFSYDCFSRLLSKESPEEKVFYLYDQEYEIGTLSTSNEILDLKVLGLGLSGDIGAAVAIETNKKVFAPLHDFNGHIIAIISIGGVVAEKYEIDAFGKEKGPFRPANPWRFCSKRSEEGFIFFGKRFYDPTIGRWVTPDPTGFADGPNLYLYVLNNPLNRLDLFGLHSDPTFPWSTHSESSIDIAVDKLLPPPNVKEVMVCKGTLGGVEMDYVVACGHWHKLRFTPEELSAGKINILDHFHELMPKEGMMIGVVTAQNGIMNSLDDFTNMSKSIVKNIEETTLFIGIHNPTTGNFFSDYKRINKEVLGEDTPIVCLTRQFMGAISQQLKNVNPDLLWKHVSHSEGGLIAYRALEGIPEEERGHIKDKMISLSFGPARPIPKTLSSKAVNIYSKLDFVTKGSARPFRKDSNYDISFVECLSSFSERVVGLVDHGILQTTYQRNLGREFEQSRGKYGFYNVQKR